MNTTYNISYIKTISCIDICETRELHIIALKATILQM